MVILLYYILTFVANESKQMDADGLDASCCLTYIMIHEDFLYRCRAGDPGYPLIR